jgi:aerobic-type carbon monoxide dehydrogenase small subunit (CoxS/CutS family)
MGDVGQIKVQTEAESHQGVVEDADGFSRRTFIKGVIATGASVSASSYVYKDGATVRAQAPGAVERLLTLRVNGQQRRVDVVPQETLATTLRYKLGLTGTKIGCDRSECGACTVLVDGVPHYSCSMLTHQVRDREVQTIEGLEAPDGTLSPVQQAVIDEQGFQCAFCMPGFVMNMTSLVEEQPNATRAEAAQHLSGNLCRCADYNKILNVAERALELSRRS